MSDLPDGFERHFRKSPVTEPWEPLYSRPGAASVEIGLIVAAAHCNSRGFVHGGVIAALADNAMGLSYGMARSRARVDSATHSGAVTVSLALDYAASAKIGQWLQITPRVLLEAVTGSDRAAAKRTFDAMMEMQKIDIATIEAARRGPARP